MKDPGPEGFSQEPATPVEIAHGMRLIIDLQIPNLGVTRSNRVGSPIFSMHKGISATLFVRPAFTKITNVYS
jgi:hypothetical protein